MRKTIPVFVAVALLAVLVSVGSPRHRSAFVTAEADTSTGDEPLPTNRSAPVSISWSGRKVRVQADQRAADGGGMAVSSFPDSPPIASLIAVGQADVAGNAVIAGSAGAVEPLSAVYLAGLDTGWITTTTALANGSFQVSLFAPPGAWIQVKHGGELRDPPLTASEEDVSWLNALPGTIVRASVPDLGPPNALPFAAAGTVRKSGAWMLQGHVVSDTSGVDVAVTVSGTLRVTSPAITSSTTIADGQVPGFVSVRRFFDQQGQQVPVGNVFASTFTTPTGLPISRQPAEQSPIGGDVIVTGWRNVTEHVMEASISGTLHIPAGTQPGFYRPYLRFGFQAIPTDPGPPFARMGVGYREEAAYLPLIRIGNPPTPRLIWTLLSNSLSNATRGTTARHDKPRFGLSPHIITQAEAFIVPRTDPRTGQPLAYRLEPFLPLIALADRGVPDRPSLPFELPSGLLEVAVQHPDGTVDTLGPLPFQQSTSRSPTNRQGKVLDEGGGRIDDMYQLTTLDDTFAYTFQQYGHHVITVTGTMEDTWGNLYQGDGTYDVVVARPLTLDPGQLPTTPYVVGDAFAPGLQVYPPVPADVEIVLTHMPDSDPAQAPGHSRFVAGQANRFGYFHPPVGSVITFTAPGEFRVDIFASFTDPADGTLWMGSATWGNVVERLGTPLVAHGRRGLDLAGPHDRLWFFHRDLGISAGGLHSMYPYWSGDVLWGSQVDDQVGGDAIIPAVTLHDTAGTIESIIEQRWNTRAHSDLFEGTVFTDRVQLDELPLFSTTADGHDLLWSPDLIDHYGYAYRSSERPGVRVHETVSEDALGISYWRFDAEFGGQAGFEGDMPNDLKWQFGGAVLRVLSETNPINEYAIYGSLWVLLPNDDPDGSRVMPPFQGAAGGPGGRNGGPIMTLKGQDVDLFFLPKGVQPGDILEVGDTFSFSGHVGPPLASQVMVTVTSPSSAVTTFEGQANKVGWFYNPAFDFAVDEAGVWTVEVQVRHDDVVPSTGLAPSTNNTGGVLGSTDGRYRFYVVDKDRPRLPVLSPQPGYLAWPRDELTQEPITVTTVPITVPVPPGLTHAVVSYTIRMPGFILEQGTITPSGGTFTIVYDPVALHREFPNLDLKARDANQPGLADPVLITFLLSGDRHAGLAARQISERVHLAGALFLHGEEVLAPSLVPGGSVYLPLVVRNATQAQR